MATKSTKEMTKTISLDSSCYGTPQPQIEVHFPEGTSRRKLHAELHKLAAEVELATPENEHWNVNMEDYEDNSGCVYLELMDGTRAEAKRGMAVLKKVVG